MNNQPMWEDDKNSEGGDDGLRTMGELECAGSSELEFELYDITNSAQMSFRNKLAAIRENLNRVRKFVCDNPRTR